MDLELIKTMTGPNVRQTREVWRAGDGFFVLSTLDLWMVSQKFQHLLGPDERFETLVLPCDETGHVDDVSDFVHRVHAGDPGSARDLALDWLRGERAS